MARVRHWHFNQSLELEISILRKEFIYFHTLFNSFLCEGIDLELGIDHFELLYLCHLLVDFVQEFVAWSKKLFELKLQNTAGYQAWKHSAEYLFSGD